MGDALCYSNVLYGKIKCSTSEFHAGMCRHQILFQIFISLFSYNYYNNYIIVYSHTSYSYSIIVKCSYLIDSHCRKLVSYSSSLPLYPADLSMSEE